MMRLALAALAAMLALGGCTTYHAYEGPRLARHELAFLRVPTTPDAIDGASVPLENVSTVALAPGHHSVEWTFTYPNGYEAPQVLEFEAEAGRWYKVGQRFFPEPNPLGLVGETIDLAVSTALLPITLLFPPEAGDAPPPGDYYRWITSEEPFGLVAGFAPDVPQAHPVITFVPVGEDDGWDD